MDIGGVNNGGFDNAGINNGGTPLGEITARVGRSLGLSGYAGLTEAKKEEIIMRCKDVETKKQMQKVVDSLAPGMDIQEVYEEEGGFFLK